MPKKILNEAVRAKEQCFRSGPNVIERQTCDRIDDGSHEVERQPTIKVKTRSTKQQIAPKQRDRKESELNSPPSSSVPSRVQENLDMESLTHQTDMSFPNVKSQPPDITPTSIDLCGP